MGRRHLEVVVAEVLAHREGDDAGVVSTREVAPSGHDLPRVALGKLREALGDEPPGDARRRVEHARAAVDEFAKALCVVDIAHVSFFLPVIQRFRV